MMAKEVEASEAEGQDVAIANITEVTVTGEQQVQFVQYQGQTMSYTLTAKVSDGEDALTVIQELNNTVQAYLAGSFEGVKVKMSEDGMLQIDKGSLPEPILAAKPAATAAARPVAASPSNGPVRPPAARNGQSQPRVVNGVGRPQGNRVAKVLDWEALDIALSGGTDAEGNALPDSLGFGTTTEVWYNAEGQYGPNINGSKIGLGYYKLDSIPDWFAAKHFD